MSSDENSSNGCYFCPQTAVTESHHLVPRRYDGPDSADNLVEVCPTCHAKLEQLYDERFYQHLRLQFADTVVRVDGDAGGDAGFDEEEVECSGCRKMLPLSADHLWHFTPAHHPNADSMSLFIVCPFCGISTSRGSGIGPHVYWGALIDEIADRQDGLLKQYSKVWN